MVKSHTSARGKALVVLAGFALAGTALVGGASVTSAGGLDEGDKPCTLLVHFVGEVSYAPGTILPFRGPDGTFFARCNGDDGKFERASPAHVAGAQLGQSLKGQSSSVFQGPPPTH